MRSSSLERGVAANIRNAFTRIAFTALFAWLSSGMALAQGYPSKPIRLIVPLAAGGTADIVARYAAQELAKALGQSIFVENKTGAGGTIAMAELARAAPDGYTLAFTSQGTLVFNPTVYENPGYDSQKDFQP